MPPVTRQHTLRYFTIHLKNFAGTASFPLPPVSLGTVLQCLWLWLR